MLWVCVCVSVCEYMCVSKCACVCQEREKKIPFFYHAHFLSLRKNIVFLKLKNEEKENEISVFVLWRERESTHVVKGTRSIKTNWNTLIDLRFHRNQIFRMKKTILREKICYFFGRLDRFGSLELNCNAQNDLLRTLANQY